MFEKPQKRLEQEKGLEQMAEVAGKTMQKEAERGMKPKQLGGYLLNTKMALALALGMIAFGGKTEGQVIGGRSSQPKGPARQVAGQIVKDVMFRTNVAINNSQSRREMKAMDEYTKADAELTNQEMAIDTHYGMEKFKAQRDKDIQKLNELEREHHRQKAEIARARARLRGGYNVKQSGVRATTGIIGAVFGEAGRRF